MIIDYQLGSNNIWTQEKIAAKMGTTTKGTSASGAASGLRSITGLNFEVQQISSLPLISALRTNINSYVGLMLLFDMHVMYAGYSGYHAAAAKGYSSSTVIYLDPWGYDKGVYGEHEVSLSQMTNAIKSIGGVYIW